MPDNAPLPEQATATQRTTYAGRMKKKPPERPQSVSPWDVVVIDSSDEEDKKEVPKQSKENEEEQPKKDDDGQLKKGGDEQLEKDKAENVPPPDTTSTSTSKREERVFLAPATPAGVSQKPELSASSTVLPTNSQHARQESITSLKGEGIEEHSDANSTFIRKRRKQRDEPERMQFLKNERWCEEVEPHRILCGRCGKWQDLHPKRRYIMQPWIDHKRTCPGRSTGYVRASTVESVASTEQLKAPPAKPIIPDVSSGDTLSPMEAEGKTALEKDLRTGEIRPHEVFCTQCATWIKLYPSTKYHTRNWFLHVQQCSGVASSSKTTIPQYIPEEEEGYRTSAEPSWPTRPPVTTAHNSDHSSPTSRKRPRESDSEASVDLEAWAGFEEWRRQRRRTQSYIPAAGWALWDAITIPITSFFNGFRHGMSR